MDARKIGRMKTSALYTWLTYYERTKNVSMARAIEAELRIRRHEEA